MDLQETGLMSAFYSTVHTTSLSRPNLQKRKTKMKKYLLHCSEKRRTYSKIDRITITGVELPAQWQRAESAATQRVACASETSSSAFRRDHWAERAVQRRFVQKPKRSNSSFDGKKVLFFFNIVFEWRDSYWRKKLKIQKTITCHVSGLRNTPACARNEKGHDGHV